MANEKNKIKELVADDEATAELELITEKHEGRATQQLESEADTSSFSTPEAEDRQSLEQLRSELRASTENANRIQFELEQLRSRAQGLETELGAREKITSQLNDEIADIRESMRRKEKLIRQRDDTIRQLKSEIRDRHEKLQETIAAHEQALEGLERDKASLGEILEVENTGQYQQRLAEQAGRLASHEASLREFREKHERAERYGDSLRRQLQEAQETAAAAVQKRDGLEHELARRVARVEELQTGVAELEDKKATLEEELARIHDRHAEEIRMIRFELGEAQETVAQQELTNEQLASDLVQTRGFKVELENMLDKTDRESRNRIDELEHDNQRLQQDNQELNEQIAAKSEAINCLLQELARKTQQVESIEEIEHVIEDIDQHVAERMDDHNGLEKDRTTRVLIGSVEGQELRFPLFKPRLTIGRTEQNDVQLKAPYISRRHAVIVTEGDATRVIDWGSKNGVFVNGARVTEHFLTSGDILAIGTAKFRYEERPKRDA